MDTQQRIKDQVTGNPVVLYMKGTPQMPQCGFSAMAIQVLQACGVQSPFTVDVLADPRHPPRHQAVRQLADHPAALRKGRVRRRLGYLERDVPVGGIAKAAGRASPADLDRGLRTYVCLQSRAVMAALARGRQPGQPAHDPPVPSTPVLTYHPVPDIA